MLSSLNLQDVEPRSVTDEPVTVTEFVTFDGLAITAESVERDDEPWVAFRADYRPPEEESEPEVDETGGTDVAAEALDLDRRLSPWRYRIASFQFDQMTRRLDDLLRDLPEESADE